VIEITIYLHICGRLLL